MIQADVPPPALFDPEKDLPQVKAAVRTHWERHGCGCRQTLRDLQLTALGHIQAACAAAEENQHV
jgi:hypothetical protein